MCKSDGPYTLINADCMIYVKAIKNVESINDSRKIQSSNSKKISIPFFLTHAAIGVFFFTDENELHENVTCLVDGEERFLKKIDNNIYYLKLRYSFDELVDFYNCAIKPCDRNLIYKIDNLSGKFKDVVWFSLY